MLVLWGLWVQCNDFFTRFKRKFTFPQFSIVPNFGTGYGKVTEKLRKIYREVKIYVNVYISIKKFFLRRPIRSPPSDVLIYGRRLVGTYWYLRRQCQIKGMWHVIKNRER